MRYKFVYEPEPDKPMYRYIGGIEEFDIWVRDRKRWDSDYWELWLIGDSARMNDYTCDFGPRRTGHLPTLALESDHLRAVNNVLGEDGMERLRAMLWCFAPHAMKKPLYPEFKKPKE